MHEASGRGAFSAAGSVAYLDRGLRPEAPLESNAAVARHLLAASLDDLGGRPIKGPSDEGDARIARMMADEAKAAVNRSGGKSSLGWYTASINRMVGAAALMHPELLDDAAARAVPAAGFKSALDAQCVLFSAMALTSQNITVRDNMRYALEQYRHFAEHGRFEPRGYGSKGLAIKGNLARFNLMVEAADGDVSAVRKMLNTRYTMGELRTSAARHGIRMGGRELVDEAVHGSMVFGPKIGAFYQNLCGNFGINTLTIDLWLMRTWGRYTGTLMRDQVSPEQVKRLATGLKVGKRMAAKMAEEGITARPSDVRRMDQDQLLALSKDLYRFWERTRKALAQAGWDNARLSEHKALMGWPGAAEAVIKTIGHSVDHPGGGRSRQWIRSVAARALDLLADEGYQMQAADMQALLWYPEKALWDVIAGRTVGSLNMSYDEAISAIATEEGWDGPDVEAAMRASGGDGRGGRGLRGGDGRGAAVGAEGVLQGPDGDLDGEAAERAGIAA